MTAVYNPIDQTIDVTMSAPFDETTPPSEFAFTVLEGGIPASLNACFFGSSTVVRLGLDNPLGDPDTTIAYSNVAQPWVYPPAGATPVPSWSAFPVSDI